MLQKASMRTAIAVLIVSLLAACSGNGGGKEEGGPSGVTTPPKAMKEPVTLGFVFGSVNQQEFDKFYVEPLREKFPHITFKGYPPGPGANINDLVTAGTIPEIFIGSKGAITNQLNPLGLVNDISPLIKSNGYDLGRLDPATVDIMQKVANGKIVGLPLNLDANALYYNKDLFDKFGVAYPKDGMTWDDIYGIAAKLTRVDQGVQYRGFSDRWGDTFFLRNPFNLPYLDPKEEKTTFLNEDWKKVIDNWLRFYTLPGLKFDAKTANKEEDRKVFTSGLSAMTVMTLDIPSWKFNWDVVSIPAYKEKPGIGLQANALYNYILKGSKNQQAAFEVAAYMTSDEYQTRMSKDGRFPVLTNDKIKKAFMENEPLYKGKNIAAFSYNKFAPEPQGRSPGLVNNVNVQDKFLLPEMINLLLGTKDVNTALRSADEASVKALAEEKAK
ncbi:ABC transporter substrate-binding protein [Paenibacillus ginsengarvi]|uniref:Extracellular solute-binding protein n=1 Tax=Paenibacillus ginsengarvi TaxID=400777 RepID=A0A3B0BHZ2_9BACL|nr:extracellular solute-binding protein [Paenibacillus ginsengarvi]RKN71884.1 extracellular solute-binding protein [Paenibacillus ginsengarvi]